MRLVRVGLVRHAQHDEAGAEQVGDVSYPRMSGRALGAAASSEHLAPKLGLSIQPRGCLLHRCPAEEKPSQRLGFVPRRLCLGRIFWQHQARAQQGERGRHYQPLAPAR